MLLRKNFWRLVKEILVIFLGVVVLGTMSLSHAGQGNVRSIQEFVDNQGTFCFPDGMGGCVIFLPPIENFLGFFDPNGRSVSIDYAGLANAFIENNGGASLGTEFFGTIIERNLKDGRAEVNVLLRTKKALTWVIDGFDFANNPLLFGNRAPDVLFGEEPGLCNSFLQLKFINTAPGAPIPDILQLIAFPEEGQELRFLAIRCNGSGPLQEAFGVPNGTPGRVNVVQTGLFMTSSKGAVEDNFPVERIDLMVVGR